MRIAGLHSTGGSCLDPTGSLANAVTDHASNQLAGIKSFFRSSGARVFQLRRKEK
jgi:hypothetical protein